MPFRLSRAYLNATVSCASVALLVAYESVVFIRALVLGIAAEWREIQLLAAVFTGGLLFLGVLMVLNVQYFSRAIVSILAVQRLRAVAQAPHDVPLAAFQPQPALALRDGETLRLERARGFGAILRGFVVAAVVIALALICGEIFFLIFLPAFAQTALYLFNSLISLPSPAPPKITALDWLSLAAPPLLGSLLLITMTVVAIQSQHETIIADDTGLTVLRSGKRRRFIPWSDIAHVLCGVNNTSDAPQGGHFLWGHAHGLFLQIAALPKAHSATMARGARTAGMCIAGDPASYQYNAQRLLATICARGYQPLRYWVGAERFVAGIRNRFPIVGLIASTVGGLPEAAHALQPHEAAVAAARLDQAPSFVLAAKLQVNWLAVTIESLVYAAFLGGLAYIAAFANQMITPSSVAAGDPASLIALAIMIPFITGLAVLFAVARRQARAPGVRVTPTGLRATRANQKSGASREISWAEIQAWAVVPATPGSRRPATYVVFGGALPLRWVEPEHARLAGHGVTGDRAVAFRLRAEELHALIVARTGLALRDGSPTASMRAGATPMNV